MPLRPMFASRRIRAFAALAVTVLLALGASALRAPRPIAADQGHAMTDESMRLWIADYYRVHPMHGSASLAGSVADTFTVQNFRFNTDGNASTQIDTAKILVGQQVLFKLISGFHTTTSGNPGDPTAGSHWNLPVDSFNQEQLVQLDTVGTYPFFCSPHGAGFNMKGVIVVSPAPVDVPASSASRDQVAFVSAAWPNPSSSGASLRFAIPRPGLVTLRIFDPAGRVVATVANENLEPGTHTRRWNGRRTDGTPAAAGVYWARLEAAGRRASLRLVLER